MAMSKQAETSNQAIAGKVDCCCNSQTPATKAETMYISIVIFRSYY
jgi:hypothetical protein